MAKYFLDINLVPGMRKIQQLISWFFDPLFSEAVEMRIELI